MAKSALCEYIEKNKLVSAVLILQLHHIGRSQVVDWFGILVAVGCGCGVVVEYCSGSHDGGKETRPVELPLTDRHAPTVMEHLTRFRCFRTQDSLSSGIQDLLETWHWINFYYYHSTQRADCQGAGWSVRYHQ